ncbi:hypothetical protein B0H11DRAFT_2399253 [Mycena galericulata]|nr:hypothetical protein B0H11DRAFT_2399253 [Mycena galericulata]
MWFGEASQRPLVRPWQVPTAGAPLAARLEHPRLYLEKRQIIFLEISSPDKGARQRSAATGAKYVVKLLRWRVLDREDLSSAYPTLPRYLGRPQCPLLSLQPLNPEAYGGARMRTTGEFTGVGAPPASAPPSSSSCHAPPHPLTSRAHASGGEQPCAGAQAGRTRRRATVNGGEDALFGDEEGRMAGDGACGSGYAISIRPPWVPPPDE